MPGNPKYLLTDSHIGYRFMDPSRTPGNRYGEGELRPGLSA